jgi:hypothetical protein
MAKLLPAKHGSGLPAKVPSRVPGTTCAAPDAPDAVVRIFDSVGAGSGNAR